MAIDRLFKIIVTRYIVHGYAVHVGTGLIPQYTVLVVR